MTIAPDTGDERLARRAASPVYYDPYNIDIVHDPYPVYARLREEAPIYYNARYDFWAISRHADVEKALGDWKTFSNSRSDILELVKSKFDMPPGVLMFQDPPTHTMLRGLMGRVFTPAGWRPSRTRSGSTACDASIPTSVPMGSTSSPSWHR
jgi:cytochrome P450